MKIKRIVKTPFRGMVYNFHCKPDELFFTNGVLVHNCYARGQNMRYGRWPVDELKVADLDEVKAHFMRALDKQVKTPNILERCIQHRYPIRMGTQTDCFQLAEEKYGVSYRFIDEIMNHYDYPYVICSKSTRVAEPKYMALYEGRDHVAFQFTLSTLKEEYLARVERGAPTARERLATMKKLADAGFHVTCRISPHIPEYMDDLEVLVQALADAGVKHVISELLRVTPILNKIMIGECDFDVIKLYSKLGAKSSNSYYRYPLPEKIAMQKQLAAWCTERGITFATCADEDPSFHTAENCCGVGDLPKFCGCPMATYDTAWRYASEHGSVGFDDLINGNWCPDADELRKTWNTGYWENILLNLRFDPKTLRYDFVEVNPSLFHANEHLAQKMFF